MIDEQTDHVTNSGRLDRGNALDDALGQVATSQTDSAVVGT